MTAQVTPADSVRGREPLLPWRSGDVWTNHVNHMALRVEQSAAESAGRATLWTVTYPAGSTRPPLHFHPRQTEHFTVLDGELEITLGGSTRLIRPGEQFTTHPGEPHCIWNRSSKPVTVRWETTPALRTEHWMAMLFALAAAGQTNRQGVPPLLRLAALLHAHRAEIRLASRHPWLHGALIRLLAFVAACLGIHADRL